MQDEAHFTNGPTVTIAKATIVAEMCLSAGQAAQIPHFLRGGYSIDDVRRELQAPAAAATPSSPTDDALAKAIRKRFATQNPPGTGGTGGVG